MPRLATPSLFNQANVAFPDTKYMGSKQRLLPFITKHLQELKFDTALDAFAGSGCVSYRLKQMGTRVYSNDFLKFCYHTAHATTGNNSTYLTSDDVDRLLRVNSEAGTFIRDTYAGLFFDETDCSFLDNLYANIKDLRSPLKKSIALAAASRASMKKRPRGLFTFTGNTGWDGRRDLKISMCQQFIEAVAALNGSVFSNGRLNKAFNVDVFDLPSDTTDLVYLDPPYVSRFSDCDYTRRYHFVEGLCTYWKDADIMMETKTKKLRSYETAFASKSGVTEAFRRLFHHFRKSILVVSYSSNCLPSRNEIVSLLKEVKKNVVVHELAHRYHHGNQAHKVGDNNNSVSEYLFIAK
jgi:DNA adenine methylase